MVVELLVQAVAGAVGGNAVGAAAKDVNLGALWNTVAGALGGAGGGQILAALIPALSGGDAAGLDLGALLGQAAGGGAAGAIVTAIAGLIKNKMA